MKYYAFISGHAVVFTVDTVVIPFEYWDGEVKTSMEEFTNVELIQAVKILKEGEVPSEWDILEERKNLKVCSFQ
jgi:hypothetical protein